MKVTVQHIDGLRFLATVRRHMAVFYPATDYLVCPTMKLTTLEDVMRSLENMEHVVTLEEPVRVKARSALDAMLAAR